MSIDFDQMKDMSPDELLAHKEKIIETYISSVPPERQQRLRQLQWKIDGELRKYKDPIAKMNRMAEMFWEGVTQFKEVMNEAAGKTDANDPF